MALAKGEVKSDIFKSTKEFTPETYRLDVIADLVQFLNQPNEGLWLAKNSASNQGRGVEMIADIAEYKQSLLNKKDKWGDAVVKEEDSAKLKEKVAPSRLDNLKNLVQEMDKVVV